jgi:hypothetical protein
VAGVRVGAFEDVQGNLPALGAVLGDERFAESRRGA